MNRVVDLLPLADNEGLEEYLSHQPVLQALLKKIQQEPLNGGTSSLSKQALLRLREKVADFVFNHRHDVAVDDYSKRFSESLKHLTIVRLLSETGNSKGSLDYAIWLFSKTRKWRFTEINLWLTEHIYKIMCVQKRDLKKASVYRGLSEMYLELRQVESLGQLYYAELMSLQRNDQDNEVSVELANKYARQLRQFEVSEPSYVMLLYTFLVVCISKEFERNFEDLIKVAKEARRHIANLYNTRRVGVYLFDLRVITANLELCRYEDAKVACERYLPTMSTANVNYYVLSIYYVICCLHSRDYVRAISVTHSTTSQKGFKALSSHMHEIWRIYEAYVEFVKIVYDIHIIESDNKQFRLAKFLNETPIYSKDKRGINIAVLIIQFLFLLKQRKYSALIDRVEALKLYCYRYLKRDSTFRSHCFIRMLLCIPKADFNRIRTERYAEPYLQKLRSMPLHISDQSIEVEVVPYEDLWGMTLDLLD